MLYFVQSEVLDKNRSRGGQITEMFLRLTYIYMSTMMRTPNEVFTTEGTGYDNDLRLAPYVHRQRM